MFRKRKYVFVVLIVFFVVCTEVAILYFREPINPPRSSDVNMPVINIEGNIRKATKENKVEIVIEYDNAEKIVHFSNSAYLKWQGGSSIYYPKKNFTINFIDYDTSGDKAVSIADSWGKHSKYCLKANYVDYSQARNIVSAQIFNEIIHSRHFGDNLEEINNGGVVDGFPVSVYNNGHFLGLYTMNIPKDEWMFNMTSESGRKQAVLGEDTRTDETLLKTVATKIDGEDEGGWELEYCSTGDDIKWVMDSWNEFVTFVNDSNKDTFRAGIGKYTDIDRTIDAILYTYFIHGNDNLSKNILWVTFDGTKWIPSLYDMDGTWGMKWDGSFGEYTTDDFMLGDDGEGEPNVFYAKVIEYYSNEFAARWKELRGSVLTLTNVEKYYAEFLNKIPFKIKSLETLRWLRVPSKFINNYDQIIQFAEGRLKAFDKYFGYVG